MRAHRNAGAIALGNVLELALSLAFIGPQIPLILIGNLFSVAFIMPLILLGGLVWCGLLVWASTSTRPWPIVMVNQWGQLIEPNRPVTLAPESIRAITSAADSLRS
jgi:hypothetical protein